MSPSSSEWEEEKDEEEEGAADADADDRNSMWSRSKVPPNCSIQSTTPYASSYEVADDAVVDDEVDVAAAVSCCCSVALTADKDNPNDDTRRTSTQPTE